MPNVVHVIPTKNGNWRAVSMNESRYAWWKRVWDEWFARKGCRLAISPEMWLDKSVTEP